MGKEYFVDIPIGGHVSVYVEAENEDHAKEIAMSSDFSISIAKHDFCRKEVISVDIDEFELIEHINTGNVCHHPFWDIEVEEA